MDVNMYDCISPNWHSNQGPWFVHVVNCFRKKTCLFIIGRGKLIFYPIEHSTANKVECGKISVLQRVRKQVKVIRESNPGTLQ